MTQDDIIDAVNKPIEEDINVLKTDYVPTAEHIGAIKARCTDRKMEIAQLQSRIDALNRVCVVADSLFAPIRKVPPEVLSEILIRAMPALSLIKDPYSRYKLLAPQKARLRFELVCRTWYTVVKQTPHLWSAFFMEVRILSRAAFNMFDDYMKCARSVPLQLSIRLDACAYVISDRVIDRVKRVLHKHKSQCSSLTLIHITPNIQFSPWDTLSGDLPLLKSLLIYGRVRIPPSQAGNASAPYINAPSLTNLCLHDGAMQIFIHLSVPTLQNLLSLDIGDSIAYTMYLPSLSHCTQLQSLAWDESDAIFNDTKSNDTCCLTFPALCTLRLRLQETYSTHFFSSISPPNLQFLDVTCLEKENEDDGFGPHQEYEEYRDYEGDPVSTIIQNHTPSLRSLSIHRFPASELGHYKVLEYMPNLETLRIVDDKLTLEAGFFEFISNQDSNRCFPLPKLKLIELKVEGLSQIALADLIQRRTKTDDDNEETQNNTFITHMDIFYCADTRHGPLMELVDTRKKSIMLDGSFQDTWWDH